ncbi:MAG: hypothetical protein PF904_11530 [Kiritimatiellae bacterium]|jgi:hypothetical protein|nr:hypothetical protein [Kiritimatiellia bacterium]
MSKELDIGKCFNDGWAIYKSNMGLLILANLVVGLVSIFTIGILAGPLTVGMFLIISRLLKSDPDKPSVGDVFKGMDKFGAALVCMLIFIVVAMIASVVPIIGQLATLVISPLLMFSLMYVAYEDLNAVDAFKKIIQGVMSGKMLMPILLGIIAGLIGGLGSLACGIGALFTAPFAAVLYVCAYQQMKEGDDIIDAEIVSTESTEAPPVAPVADPVPEAESTEEADVVAEDEAPKAE